MAEAAVSVLGDRITRGVVVTKYDHSKGTLPGIEIFEAGHPVPDGNSFRATEAALNITENLTSEDTVLFLLSGGGSALFEKPLIPGEELQDITKQLLACGADIIEINTIRKRLSAVKGGRFAEHCLPAKVFSIVLSDIIGDPLDMIASGPAYPDASTSEEAERIIKKYDIKLSDKAKELLKAETPKTLANVETHITGSVKELCRAAEKAAVSLGYHPVILTDSLNCEASEAGRFLASMARYYADTTESLAFIAGGETVVHLRGKGKGGRNQELALSAAEGLKDLSATAVFSFGSDGTDGPTDAAGGYVDQDTYGKLSKIGVDVNAILGNNDAYNALSLCGGLIVTGPTGTNVNDVSILLIKR
jgi:hydroxypyruvate reductase